MKKSDFVKKLQDDIDRLQSLLESAKQDCLEANINPSNPFTIGLGARVETLREIDIAIEQIDSLE